MVRLTSKQHTTIERVVEGVKDDLHKRLPFELFGRGYLELNLSEMEQVDRAFDEACTNYFPHHDSVVVR